MRYTYFLTAAFAVSVSVCSGQSSWKFRSEDYLGVAAGQLGGAAHMQTVDGLYKGSWFLGLGAGLDYYRYRSVPLFVSVRRDLPGFDKASRSFVYLDGGINLPWYKRSLTKYQLEVIASSKFHAGAYGSAGLGYEWPLSTHTNKALLFSVGYSMKKLTEKLVGPPPCAFTGQCQVQVEQQTYTYDYVNNTFLFLVGFRF